ncbi:MAG: hypothetical protein V4509_01830 [Patescibacteria group bacterium]
MEEKTTKKSKSDVDISPSECYAICSNCAKSNEGKWPYDDYVCTQWFDDCQICKQHVACCSGRDYSWPDHKFIWSD